MARVLIIEDDDQIRRMLRSILEENNHEAIEAHDGYEGMKLFRESGADLIITDILMPEKEGIQTIMELRDDFPGVKIIAISGGGTVGPDTYLTMARELGADRVLAKPFAMNQLTELLDELL